MRAVAMHMASLIIAAGVITGCTSEPLLSRRGGVAAAELAVETVCVLGRSDFNPVEQNLEDSDLNYIGGVVPVKKEWIERDVRVDNGTRLIVDGRKRGFLPQVLKLQKPGPHVVRLEIPAHEPYEITLPATVSLRIGAKEVEAWPPIIVDCATGEIFTTSDTAHVDPDRNSGTRKKTDLQRVIGSAPILIVTTTDKRHAGWRKIGQLKFRPAVNAN